MSVHISLDPRREIKKRIELKNQLSENLKDAVAEYNELVKMNPMVNSKGSGDNIGKYTGCNEHTDKIIAMSLRKKALKKRISEYGTMISDFDRGWNLLNDEEKNILTMRFVDNMKQETVARQMKYDRRTIIRKEQEALRKMEAELLDI